MDLLSKKTYLQKKMKRKPTVSTKILKLTDYLSLLKQRNPKPFFAKLTKRSKTNAKMSLEIFYEHLKSFATTQDDRDTESGNESLDINCIF